MRSRVEFKDIGIVGCVFACFGKDELHPLIHLGLHVPQAAPTRVGSHSSDVTAKVKPTRTG